MMPNLKFHTTFSSVLLKGLIAGALSRAITKREGRAPIGSMVAESTLPALDSNPTNKIRVSGGQDGLRKASNSSITKSCPQHLGKIALGENVGQLVKADGVVRRGDPVIVEDGATAATPYTDRGVEF